MQNFQPPRNHLVKKHNATTDFFEIFSLNLLGQPAHPDQFSKTVNIFTEQHWIMQKQFVTFITKNS